MPQVTHDSARRPALVGGVPLGAPDRRRALERYRAVAERYDQRTAFGEPYRRQAVRSLAPAPGDVVLDVGCGTGLNFPGSSSASAPGDGWSGSIKVPTCWPARASASSGTRWAPSP